jgi:hypothetical protein
VRLLVWANDRRIAAVAAYRTRRAFHRGHLTPAAQQQLNAATKRRTP